jgi:hypothetical protein
MSTAENFLETALLARQDKTDVRLRLVTTMYGTDSGDFQQSVKADFPAGRRKRRNGFATIAGRGYSSRAESRDSVFHKFKEGRKMSNAKDSGRNRGAMEELAHGWGELFAREAYPQGPEERGA